MDDVPPPSPLGRRDYRIMDFLRRQAIDNEGASRAKMAAAVVLKGKIISTGRNQYKTHPIATEYGKNSDAIFLHAETHAIVNSLNHLDKADLSRATLYIYRVKRPHGHLNNWVSGLAKPCIGCMRAIVEYDFKRVVYTTDNAEEFAFIQ
jgi:tRNA(Arg) A34 adenosine deaminase TadA